MRSKYKRNYKLIVGCTIIAAVLLFVLIGCFFTPYDPNGMDGSAKNLAPGIKHLFGTDNFGRDILSRVMEGSRTTFFVALCTVLIGSVFGVIIGALTGYYGGLLDEVIMRVNDVITSFPSILLALIFVSILGIGTFNIILALGIIFIPSFSRVVRSEFITYRQRDFVLNAKLMGASDLRIMFLYILPNTFPVLLSSILIGFNNAVLAEAGMSFLGLGVQPPDASLGRMLSESQAYLFQAPWYALAPGCLIVLAVLGVGMVGDEI